MSGAPNLETHHALCRLPVENSRGSPVDMDYPDSDLGGMVVTLNVMTATLRQLLPRMSSPKWPPGRINCKGIRIWPYCLYDCPVIETLQRGWTWTH